MVIEKRGGPNGPLPIFKSSFFMLLQRMSFQNIRISETYIVIFFIF